LGSSNGRTLISDIKNVGSTPSPKIFYDKGVSW